MYMYMLSTFIISYTLLVTLCLAQKRTTRLFLIVNLHRVDC